MRRDDYSLLELDRVPTTEELKETGVYELYYIALATGLRRGEPLGLKWQDIDLDNGILHIRRQIARINGEVVEAPLKTKNFQQICIPVPNRWFYFPGQRFTYASSSIRQSWSAQGSIP